MSDEPTEPTEREVRNTAICLLAADACLVDSLTPDEALAFAHRIVKAVDTDPIWADGRHEGDCTKTPMTCARCHLETMEKEARERWTT
jgi:hypothetical protein